MLLCSKTCSEKQYNSAARLGYIYVCNPYLNWAYQLEITVETSTAFKYNIKKPTEVFNYNIFKPYTNSSSYTEVAAEGLPTFLSLTLPSAVHLADCFIEVY